MEENLWSTIVGLVIVLCVVGIPSWLYISSYDEIENRVASGRSTLGAIWDVAVSKIGGAGIAVLTFALIVAVVFPQIQKVATHNKGKTEGGDLLILAVTDPDEIPGLISEMGKQALGLSQQSDPWASTSAALGIDPTTTAAAAIGPDIAVFTSVRFADGRSRDVCAVRADSSGVYNLAVLCDENDVVSLETLSLAGADTTPLAGALSAAAAPVDTQEAPATQQQLLSPLLFQQYEEAARCFFVLLSSRTSELEKYGDSLLPAGSQWVVNNSQWTFFIPGRDEEWTLCSVQYPQFGCLQLNGLQAKALGGKGEVVGSGTTFPGQCVVPTTP